MVIKNSIEHLIEIVRRYLKASTTRKQSNIRIYRKMAVTERSSATKHKVTIQIHCENLVLDLTVTRFSVQLVGIDQRRIAEPSVHMDSKKICTLYINDLFIRDMKLIQTSFSYREYMPWSYISHLCRNELNLILSLSSHQ